MSFKDRKRDDHGHVIGNDEVDGQECKHQSGGSGNKNWQKKDTPGADVYEREVNGEKHIALKSKIDGSIHYFKGNTAKTEEVDGFEDSPFDDDYEEEFNEPSPEDEKQYVDKVMADIADASDKKAFEYVSDNIDELTEAGLISDETSDKLYDALDRKIDEVNNDIDKDLMDAINMADDDVLDEEFGKDTPERKLAGAMKQPQPTDTNNIDERDNLKTGDTAYYNGKKVTISTAGLKDNELGGIQIKARDEDGHVYELSSRQLDKPEQRKADMYKEYIDKYYDGDIDEFIRHSEDRAKFWKKHGENDFAKRFDDDIQLVRKLLKKEDK